MRESFCTYCYADGVSERSLEQETKSDSVCMPIVPEPGVQMLMGGQNA